MKRIIIINGVNLGELGTREVALYGNLTFDVYLQILKAKFPQIEIDFYQTDQIGRAHV